MFINLGLLLGMALKFYTNVLKWFKLTVRKFLGLIPTFLKVTGEKVLVGALKVCPKKEQKLTKCYIDITSFWFLFFYPNS